VNRTIKLSLLILAAVALGCDKEEKVTSFQAPKDPAQMQTPVAEQTPEPGSQLPVSWTLPQGWKAVPAHQFTLATFQIGDDPKSVLTVAPLPAGAAEMMPNLQRWAGQLGLSAPSDTDGAKYVHPTQVAGEQGQVVDMTGAQQRLLAAIVPHDNQTWFFTLKAPPEVAAAQKGNFDTFVQSIRFTNPQAEQPAPPPQVAAPSGSMGSTPGIVKFTTPAGWTQEPNANAMRILTMRVGSSDKAAQMVASRLPAGRFGDWQSNIDRWRGQAGLAASTGPSQPAATIPMGGKEAQLFEFNGPQGDLMVGYLVRGEDAWFFKLFGPADVVAPQKPAFIDFLKSIQFE
jgi:hypothetical protein